VTGPPQTAAAERALLHERFPELAGALPRLELGHGPTPVRELGALPGAGVPVWVKEDGRYGAPAGGNKARKLEWTLADALRRRRRAIVTIGALATNHGLATALYARQQGLETVLLLVDQPIDEHVRAQLDRLERSGAAIYRTRGTIRTAATLPWAMLRHADWRRGRLPYFLAVGGSSPLGCLGGVEAALELARQVAAGEVPEPSHAVVALGSGGTAAGLALGLRLAELRTRVVAILVTDKLPLSERSLARLARRALGLLRRRGASVPEISISARDLEVERRWVGPGYGHRTPEAERAMEIASREGLALEPVYTAKAMAGLLALRSEEAFGSGPVLFWDTHDPSPGPEASPPEAPAPAEG
jgi:D-cysteine desulfhydrase